MCSGLLSSPASLPGLRVDLESELGRDHHLVAEGREGFADEFFVREWAVDFRGVEERDATFHRARMTPIMSCFSFGGP